MLCRSQECAQAASAYNTGAPANVWCHLNAEGDLLEKMIPDAIQVSGKDCDDRKEEKLVSFSEGKSRILITKPKIGAWGMNWQHCSHVVTFPSHSYEQYYQLIRRNYRFGQTKPVHVDIVTTEGERDVLKNLQRKSAQADKMFDRLTTEMNNALHIDRSFQFTKEIDIPAWL